MKVYNKICRVLCVIFVIHAVCYFSPESVYADPAEDIRKKAKRVSDKAKRLLETLGGKTWYDHDIEGADKQGRRAKFRIRILSQEYRWVFGSSDMIEIGNSRDEDGREIRRLFEKRNMQEYMRRMTDVIAVGTASVEGERREEVQRANERADRILSWIRPLPFRDPPIGLHKLNLGQFRQVCDPGSENTSHQRRLIIVGVLEKETGSNICQALYNTLTGISLERLPFNVRCYSNFECTDVSGDQLLPQPVLILR